MDIPPNGAENPAEASSALLATAETAHGHERQVVTDLAGPAWDGSVDQYMDGVSDDGNDDDVNDDDGEADDEEYEVNERIGDTQMLQIILKQMRVFRADISGELKKLAEKIDARRFEDRPLVASDGVDRVAGELPTRIDSSPSSMTANLADVEDTMTTGVGRGLNEWKVRMRSRMDERLSAADQRLEDRCDELEQLFRAEVMAANEANVRRDSQTSAFLQTSIQRNRDEIERDFANRMAQQQTATAGEIDRRAGDIRRAVDTAVDNLTADTQDQVAAIGERCERRIGDLERRLRRRESRATTGTWLMLLLLGYVALMLMGFLATRGSLVGIKWTNWTIGSAQFEALLHLYGKSSVESGRETRDDRLMSGDSQLADVSVKDAATSERGNTRDSTGDQSQTAGWHGHGADNDDADNDDDENDGDGDGDDADGGNDFENVSDEEEPLRDFGSVGTGLRKDAEDHHVANGGSDSVEAGNTEEVVSSEQDITDESQRGNDIPQAAASGSDDAVNLIHSDKISTDDAIDDNVHNQDIAEIEERDSNEKSENSERPPAVFEDEEMPSKHRKGYQELDKPEERQATGSSIQNGTTNVSDSSKERVENDVVGNDIHGDDVDCYKEV